VSDSFTQFGFNDDTPEVAKPQPSYHLTIELVPASSWGANLRSVLPKRDWDILRKKTYRLAGHRCEICGGKGSRHPVECHEVWDYDDEALVQTLVRLIALCPSCHEVKHFGLAEKRGKGPRAFGHMMRVNGWRQDQAQGHLYQAFDKWQARSRHEWTLDLTWLIENDVEVPKPPAESELAEHLRYGGVMLTEAKSSDLCRECSGPMYPSSSKERYCGTVGCSMKDRPVPLEG
jgi:hypothetical protein